MTKENIEAERIKQEINENLADIYIKEDIAGFGDACKYWINKNPKSDGLKNKEIPSSILEEISKIDSPYKMAVKLYGLDFSTGDVGTIFEDVACEMFPD